MATKKTTARKGSKKDQVLSMVRRKSGATLEQIMTATGWQAHTCPAFCSLNKIGRTAEGRYKIG